MSYFIRNAKIEDLESIQSIYNHEVLNSMATWNHEAKNLDYFKQWYQQLKNYHFPLFVIENRLNYQVIGYADYSTFRSISGLKQTVEHSIFIAAQYTRLGLGTQLLEKLIQHARQQNLHIMVAAID